MKANVKLDRSNEYYKLQGQSLLQVVPKDGKLIMRCYMGHHYDAIPMEDDPEKAQAYIISAYDPYMDMPQGVTSKWNGPFSGSGATAPLYNDNFNQKIADPNDEKALLERYVVWTADLNFVMDGKGNILSETVDSPIPGVLPFIDVAYEKDFEYFIRQGQGVTDFSVQYNSAISDLANIVRMQGWGQAYLIAEKDLIPQNLQIGPNFILKLPMDPNSDIRPEFGFANARPDLEGAIKYIELLLANFLSANGIDPKAISGKSDSNRFSSGVERLLAMVERFEASQSDFEMYRWAEQRLYWIVKSWHNALNGTDQLFPQYKTQDLSDDSMVEISFTKPEAIQTESEMLDTISQKMDLGLLGRDEAISELRKIPIERAREVMAEMDSTGIQQVNGDSGT
jgi:hypothetical protein